MDIAGACDVTSMSTHRYATPPGAGVLVALLAPIVLLAVACSPSGSSGGSGGSPSAGGSSTSASAVAYSACMRNHGVPNYPDPGSNGQVSKGDAQRFGVSVSQLQAAQRACQEVYPASSLAQCQGTGACSLAARQALLGRMRDFATCMRSHGIANWPDPTVDSQGRPGFRGPAADIPPGSRTDHTANQICHHLLPPGVGVLGAP